MNRLTVAYEPAISLIEILLDSSGVSLQGAPQEIRLAGFLFDMNRFFQRLTGAIPSGEPAGSPCPGGESHQGHHGVLTGI